MPVRLTNLRQLAALAAASTALALALSGCQFTASTSTTASNTTYLRVIDASYQAPAADAYIGSLEIASNLGEGSFSDYAGVGSAAAVAASLKQHDQPTTLVSQDVTLTAKKIQSLLVTDQGNGYQLTVLTDQGTAAPTGESTFRFINQATGVGAVDVYMVPGTATLATSKPILTNLAAGAVSNYISFASQPVTMVVTPTGSVSKVAINTSTALSLSGGEVTTVLIMNSQLTTTPSLITFSGSDIYN